MASYLKEIILTILEKNIKEYKQFYSFTPTSKKEISNFYNDFKVCRSKFLKDPDLLLSLKIQCFFTLYILIFAYLDDYIRNSYSFIPFNTLGYFILCFVSESLFHFIILFKDDPCLYILYNSSSLMSVYIYILTLFFKESVSVVIVFAFIKPLSLLFIHFSLYRKVFNEKKKIQEEILEKRYFWSTFERDMYSSDLESENEFECYSSDDLDELYEPMEVIAGLNAVEINGDVFHFNSSVTWDLVPT